MKTTFLAILLTLLVCVCPSYSQAKKELTAGYYVVVGAYAATRENVAQNYVDVLQRQGYTAEYGFNASRKLFFVYIRYFDNLKGSLRDMQKTRSAGKFTDAWVRVVPGVVEATPTVAANTSAPVTENKAVAPPPASGPQEPVAAIETAPTPPETVTASASDAIVVTDNPEIKQYQKITLGNTEVFLSMYNAGKSRIVDGDIDVMDKDRSRVITKAKGNEYLMLPDPKNNSGNLVLVCETFGYRKVQQEISYPLPLADTAKPNIDLMGTTFVINFDLARYRKGDMATLQNVTFYNDAALMLPESQGELNSLLQMMQEDDGYKIRLHGHTNGNYHGKIVTMGPEKKFFTLDGSTQWMGSAKDLSLHRAEVIKEYLVHNGVSAERIEVKAWGGKRPIYDKNSVNAKKNVRVDVEILEE